MHKKFLFFVLFLLILSNVFSAKLTGISDSDYSIQDFPAEGKTIFVLGNPENKVFFSSETLAVSNPSVNTDYFVEVSEATILAPFSGQNSIFLGENPANTIVFDVSISGVILKGEINLVLEENSLDLIISGDLITESSSALIDSSGRDGALEEQGIKGGNIIVQGKTIVSEEKFLSIKASGGNGGDYASGSSGGEIKLNNLSLLDNSSVFFESNGGSGGKDEQSEQEISCKDLQKNCISGCNNAENYEICRERCDIAFIECMSNYTQIFTQSFGADAGKITINNIELNENPELSFLALKGTGINSVDLKDGIITIKGCNLKTLNFGLCQIGTLNIFSDDSIELMDNLDSVCIKPLTQIQPKINCDCFSAGESLNRTEMIFSLTGDIKSFEGENLSGNIKNFLLEKELVEGIIAFDSASNNFSDGFFNFSFGKNQLIFSNINLGFFNFLFSFVVDVPGSDLTDLMSGNIRLISEESNQQTRCDNP